MLNVCLPNVANSYQFWMSLTMIEKDGNKERMKEIEKDHKCTRWTWIIIIGKWYAECNSKTQKKKRTSSDVARERYVKYARHNWDFVRSKKQQNRKRRRKKRENSKLKEKRKHQMTKIDTTQLQSISCKCLTCNNVTGAIRFLPVRKWPNQSVAQRMVNARMIHLRIEKKKRKMKKKSFKEIHTINWTKETWK